MPSRALLQATAQNAVGWLVENRHSFDPVNVQLRGRAEKPVVELAFMLRAMRETSAAYGGLDELSALVREVARRPARRYRPTPARAHLVADAFLFAAVQREPDEDRAEHRRLQRLVDLGLLDTLEQAPHRAMEDRLALEWAGLSRAMPSWRALVDRSILAADPNPLLLDEAAAYQLTHVVIYLTAFGSRPPVVAVRTGARERERFSALLVRYSAERHWDLVAELLLSWSSLALGPSPVCEGAWRSLLEAVEPSGAVAQPPRGGATPHPESEPGGWFLDRYHPTLLTAIVADAWGRGDTADPPRRSGGRHGGALEPSLIREAADLQAAWLEEKLDADVRAHPELACGVLVGLWICAAVSPRARGRLPDAARRVVEAAHEVHDWSGVPAAHVMIAYGLTSRSGGAPHGVASFVDAAAAAVGGRPPDELQLCETRVLLHRLGAASAPDPAPLESLEAAAGQAAVEPDDDNVERLLLTSESSAAYGSHPVDAGRVEAWIPELLLALAAARARAHDLIGVGRLVRAALHIGAPPESTADAVAFLVAQQRPEGGFGLFGEATRPAASDSFAERDLVLRLSIDCLWTVAEAGTPWRLTAAIGSGRGYQ